MGLTGIGIEEQPCGILLDPRIWFNVAALLGWPRLRSRPWYCKVCSTGKAGKRRMGAVGSGAWLSCKTQGCCFRPRLRGTTHGTTAATARGNKR